MYICGGMMVEEGIYRDARVHIRAGRYDVLKGYAAKDEFGGAEM
jgi:hypothetical protein